MDFKTIYKIIHLIKNNDWEYITNYFYKYRLDRISDKTEYLQNVLKSIANQIDEECFTIIYNNIKENNYSYKQIIILTNILVYMSDEKKKQCLEIGNLDNICSTELIKSLKDIEYKKICVDNWKEFKLNNSNKMEIIKSIGELDYIIKCIERSNKIGLNNDDIFELIKLTKDTEFIKKCILKAKKIGLKSCDITELIVSLNDKNFVNYCIKNYKKFGINKND